MKKKNSLPLAALMIALGMGISPMLTSSAHAGKWFGYAHRDRTVTKIDLDADFNGDGIIDNTDPSDSGLIQVTPPGLQVRVQKLSPVILRCRIASYNWKRASINLELRGINRRNKSGTFRSLDEEIAGTGRIRLWADKHRSKLLLDSANPDLRRITYTNESGEIPSEMYLEGVSPSRYPGSFQLIAYVSNKGNIARFPNAKDYILITVIK